MATIIKIELRTSSFYAPIPIKRNKHKATTDKKVRIKPSLSSTRESFLQSSLFLQRAPFSFRFWKGEADGSGGSQCAALALRMADSCNPRINFRREAT